MKPFPVSFPSISLKLGPLAVAFAAIGLLDTWAAGQAVQPAHQESLQHLPSVFIENRGQWDGDFRYQVRVGGMAVFLDEGGWTFTLFERPARARDFGCAMTQHAPEHIAKARRVSVGMRFANSARAERIEPERPISGVHNYFLGSDPNRWRTNIPLYEGTRLVEAWRGVDVRCRIEGGRFEYDVIAGPRANLHEVAIQIEGAISLWLDGDGALVVETALGPVRQPMPKTWQTLPSGQHELIECRYVVLGADMFGFRAPSWDRQQALVIDPGLVFSTFLGGGSNDGATAVALDANGAPAVAGNTISTNFPTTLGVVDTSFNGGSSDAFVTRLSANGSTLIYSTYLGGGAQDITSGVALQADGSATVAGFTFSANFPTTAGAYQTAYLGNGDGFVTRLSPGGDALLYSTFLGGTGGGTQSHIHALATDSAGTATVAGETNALSYPVTAGAYINAPSGWDVFVTRLNASGTALVYSSRFGGANHDYCRGLALDPTGGAIVTGLTTSGNLFPTTAGAYDTSANGGADDAFVTRLTASGAMVYSTFLGGSGSDQAAAVAAGPNGEAFVVGTTSSTDFPTTAGAYDSTFNGGAHDAFLTRLSSSGNSLLYSTFLGGALDDSATAIVAFGVNGAVVTGFTASTNFPTTASGYDSLFNGGANDAFVAWIDPVNGLRYSTYIGGSSSEVATAIAGNPAGEVTVVGDTLSADYPTTPGAYATTFSGGADDPFVTRLHLPTLELSITAPLGSGSITLANTKGAPGDWYITAVTLAPGNFPQGWFFGVEIGYADLGNEVAFGPPFSGVLDGLGASTFSIPAGVPPGLTVFAVTATFLPGFGPNTQAAVPVAFVTP